MNIKEFEQFILEIFTKEKLDIVEGKDEYGFTNIGRDNIKRVGYCTNLTIESASQVVEKKVDLLITHHDAWEWMKGMKEDCMSILKEGNISHFFIHLPLDDADFGNNTELLKRLGFNIIDKFSNDEGMYCGRIGELDEPIEFEKLVDNIEKLLEEPVKSWKNNNNPIRRIGLITGAGFSSNEIKEALDLGCDVYITGEKVLYTVQYAKYVNMNLIVGSHTFTEIFGVENLAKMIKDRFKYIEVIKIEEDHVE